MCELYDVLVYCCDEALKRSMVKYMSDDSKVIFKFTLFYRAKHRLKRDITCK